MLCRLIRLLAVALLPLVLAAAPGHARKLALIIGNNSYANLDDLDKAVADAGGYAALFPQMGFHVTLALDLDSRAMAVALLDFYDSIAPGDTVLFAYSGHGWSDGRENFLMPTDIAGSGDQAAIKAASYPVRNGNDGIIDKILSRAPQLTIAIIDACRENPFTLPPQAQKVAVGAQSLSTEASGTFIAFSAGDGQQALDNISGSDPVPYSVFTRYFLHELAKPQPLQAAFKAAQKLVNDTARAIGRVQLPASYDEVVGTACLWDDCSGRSQVVVVSEDPVAAARAEWEHFKDSNSIEALEAFAERYAGTPYGALARERIAKLRAAASRRDEAEPAGDQTDVAMAGSNDPDPAVAPSDPPRVEPAKGEAQDPAGDKVDDTEADAKPPEPVVDAPLPVVADGAWGWPGGVAPAESVVVPALADEKTKVVAEDPERDKSVTGSDNAPAASDAPAGAPSWCGNIYTQTQKAICADAGLAARDLQLASELQRVLDRLKGDAQWKLRVEQQKWEIEREGCNGDLACLSQAYDARLRVVSAM